MRFDPLEILFSQNNVLAHSAAHRRRGGSVGTHREVRRHDGPGEVGPQERHMKERAKKNAQAAAQAGAPPPRRIVMSVLPWPA